MDLPSVQLAPLTAADHKLNMMANRGESFIPSSKKRKRAVETLDLREFVSYLPSPTPSKRSRLTLLISLHTTLASETLTPWTPSSSSSQHPASYFNPFPPSPGSAATPAKRKRTGLPLKHFPRPQPTSATSYTPPITPNLLPCHICHRRPSIHSDLASYSTCEACERQTCYICMRACEGKGCQPATVTTSSSQNHVEESTQISIPKGRSICAKCCVEVGADGRVWCLVCYEDEHDLDGSGAVESDEEEEEGEIGDSRNGSCAGVEQWLEKCRNEPWSGG